MSGVITTTTTTIIILMLSTKPSLKQKCSKHCVYSISLMPYHESEKTIILSLAAEPT